MSRPAALVDPATVAHPPTRGWETRAACRGLDTTLFFVDPGNPVDAACHVCATCPVQTECLAHALHNERHGIWGGTSEKQRRRLRLQLRISTPRVGGPAGAECGTESGYNRHRRDGEHPCAACATAASAAGALRRARQADAHAAHIAERRAAS